MYTVATWVYGRDLHSLQFPEPLSQPRQDERVNDEAVKDSNLLFSVYCIWKRGQIFKKLNFFTFGPKQ